MGRGPGVRAVGGAIQLDFRWKGERCRERVRLAPTKANLLYCKRWKERIESEIATGTFDYSKHFPDSRRAHSSGGPDLVSAVRGFCESLAGQVQPETLREYLQNGEIVARAIGGTLGGVTRKKVRDWVSKQTLSKARIDNLLTPLRGTLRQAVEDGEIPQNPLEGFEVRRIGRTEDKIDPFTPEEVAALAETECGALWEFWAWTGLRSGEVIGLEWGDMEAGRTSVRIRRAVRRGRAKAPKTTAGTRVVFLVQPARRAIARLHEEAHGPVFRNPVTGKDWHEAKALNRAFARACRAAQVRRRNVYQLRHTFATWALSSGENPAWIAKQMGHTDASVLYKHYARWMPQLDPKAGSRMVSKARLRHRAA